MTRYVLAACALLAAILCLAPASHAHRVNIFAYVDGDTVVTDSGYSRTSRVMGGTVEVFDAATGQRLLSGTTDDTGHFTFPIPEPARAGTMGLRLLLTAGEGHQAEWTIKAEELAATTTVATTLAGTTAETAAAQPAQPATPAPAQPAPQAAPMPALSAAPGQQDQPAAPLTAAQVDAMLRRELAPVKQMLAELSQPGPGMTEIIGGIGYILGIFGIAAYMKSRRPAGRD